MAKKTAKKKATKTVVAKTKKTKEAKPNGVSSNGNGDLGFEQKLWLTVTCPPKTSPAQ